MASHPTPPLATERRPSDASADSAEVLKTLLSLAHHNETPDVESNCLDSLLNACKMLENNETEKQEICTKTMAVIDLCTDSTKEDASSQMIDLCTDSTKEDSSSPPLAYHPPTLRQEGDIPTKSLKSQVAFGLGEQDRGGLRSLCRDLSGAQRMETPDRKSISIWAQAEHEGRPTMVSYTVSEGVPVVFTRKGAYQLMQKFPQSSVTPEIPRQRTTSMKFGSPSPVIPAMNSLVRPEAATGRRFVSPLTTYCAPNRFSIGPTWEAPSGFSVGPTRQTHLRTKSRHCRCSKSKCLRLYCDCFAGSELCDPSVCSCNNCFNDSVDNAVRIEAIDRALKKDALAFEKHRQRRLRRRAESLSRRRWGACRCKRSRCVQKYCECFAAGIPCNAKCHCQDCFNQEETAPLDSTSPFT